MKLNRATLVLPLAGLLVVAGAGAALATGGPVPDANDELVVPAAESPSASPSTDSAPVAKDTALTEVLDDLVADGTITESQKQAILDGVVAERTARREARQAARQQVRTFLEDGVITQEEFDQLPENSRLRELEDLLGNGGITTDELRAPGRGLGRGHGWKHFGGQMPGAPDASASPATGS